MSKTFLGIELGSTRIKAVLVNEAGAVLASGAHDWENSYENGYWTYSLESVWKGIQDAYASLVQNYGKPIQVVDAIGVSAMMHGYLPFGVNGALLAPFRTWRNTTTTVAVQELTDLLQFNIPERWSIAHLYQAVLNQETHVKDIDFLTTLAGYVHWQLTGEKVLGLGDASGMFAIDSNTLDYDTAKLAIANDAIKAKGVMLDLSAILPKVLRAGDSAGALTEAGARLLDPTGTLASGVPMCPPEGDAGTGMVATNSVKQKTGNISAGTSIFAMIVLEKALSKLYREIDMVTTPCGSPVAMVHCNTCTSDLDSWVKLFDETLKTFGCTVSKDELYTKFYQSALKSAPDCGGLVNYNFFAGEPILGLTEGKPMFVRKPDATLNFANFARAQLYASVATLKIGMDILLVQENTTIDTLLGHGGFFKVPGVGQTLMAGALNVPVAVMQTASEGGPWGMAVLANYMVCKAENETLADYLQNKIFNNANAAVIEPNCDDVAGFNAYMKAYQQGLAAQKAINVSH